MLYIFHLCWLVDETLDIHLARFSLVTTTSSARVETGHVKYQLLKAAKAACCTLHIFERLDTEDSARPVCSFFTNL